MDVLDNKVVKTPPTWSGKRADWKHWNTKLCGYVGGVSVALREMMRVAASMTEKVDQSQGIQRARNGRVLL